MSSHHFVKEGQEPALIIAGEIHYERVAPLLEWAPVVIVFAEVLDTVLSWGIRTDIVLTPKNLESVTYEKTLHQQPLSIVVTENPNQEVMNQLLARNQFFANACVDNANQYFRVFEHDAIEISLIDNHARWSFIQSGTFKKWFPKGALCLLPSGTKPVKTENLLKQADNGYIVQSDGLITLECSGFFWVGEPFE